MLEATVFYMYICELYKTACEQLDQMAHLPTATAASDFQISEHPEELLKFGTLAAARRKY